MPPAKSISLQNVQSLPLFLWYDYFSVPQLEQNAFSTCDDGGGSKQTRAINSIPAYVAMCRFFVALCSTMDRPSSTAFGHRAVHGLMGASFNVFPLRLRLES